MNVYPLPNALFPDQDISASDLIIYNYQTTREASGKSKILSRKHLFNFLQEGEKEVHFYDQSIKFSPTQALLIPSGNSLMIERLSTENQYRSFLFFFSDNNLIAFQNKYPFLFTAIAKKQPERQSFFLFEQDDFIKSFVRSLYQLDLQQKSSLSEYLLQVKFDEIMLFLAGKYLHHFSSFVSALTQHTSDLPFRKVVENNLYTNLSIEELAFLCNMSLSTFKRKFEEVYNTAPSRWFHLKKMQQAAFLLKHEKAKASEIHHELGYENLSSFVQAFKKEFGKTPKVYQQSV